MGPTYPQPTPRHVIYQNLALAKLHPACPKSKPRHVVYQNFPLTKLDPAGPKSNPQHVAHQKLALAKAESRASSMGGGAFAKLFHLLPIKFASRPILHGASGSTRQASFADWDTAPALREGSCLRHNSQRENSARNLSRHVRLTR